MVMIIGQSGAGKTTSALALCAAGFGLCSDDLIICRVVGDQVVGWGLPRSLKVHRRTAGMLPWVAPLLTGEWSAEDGSRCRWRGCASVTRVEDRKPKTHRGALPAGAVGEREQGCTDRPDGDPRRCRRGSRAHQLPWRASGPWAPPGLAGRARSAACRLAGSWRAAIRPISAASSWQSSQWPRRRHEAHSPRGNALSPGRSGETERSGAGRAAPAAAAAGGGPRRDADRGGESWRTSCPSRCWLRSARS